MGYRTYISRVSKSRYDEIQKMTTKEFLNKYREYPDEDYVDSDCLKDFTLYEFGKYTDFDSKIQQLPYFPNNKELNDMFDNCDTTFSIIGKADLAIIIRTYEDKIKAYKNELLNRIDAELKEEGDTLSKNTLGALMSEITGSANDWNYGIINLNDGDDTITSSWRYEYSIFELVRIYKTFNWNDDILIFEGH